MNVDTLLIDLPTAPWQLPAFTDLGVHDGLRAIRR